MAEILVSSILPILLEQVLSSLKKIKERKTEIVTVAMFDLTGSTRVKLSNGHARGTELALEHNSLCQEISSRYNGSVVKHMGDGIFLRFQNPVEACQAALEIKHTLYEKGRFSTKAGITIGLVENIEVGGISDLLGSIIDRCARMTSLAAPDQILIDQTLHGVAYSFLKENKDMIVSDPTIKKVKGIGELILYEISLIPLGFVGFNISSLNVIEEGRMPLKEKMTYLATANEEIIELGIGLTSFSDNYYRQRPSEFKDGLIDLLKRGVKIKCYIINHESEYARMYVEYNEEPYYIERMKTSLNQLINIKKDFKSMNLDGFSIHYYDSYPSFHASCIDLDNEKGKMSITHYLPKTLRSKNPVIQFSQQSNPKLFNIYKESIVKIIENSKEINS